MDEASRKRLADKKFEIQRRIKVEGEIDRHLMDWLAIYEILLNNKIPHQIVQLATINAEDLAIWQVILQQKSLGKYSFNTALFNVTPTKNLFTKFYHAFPSVYAMRFLPTLVEPLFIGDTASENIAYFAKQLAVKNEDEIYLLYLYYFPVVSLKFADLIDHADLLFDYPLEDIVVVAKDFSWLMINTMEDEWRYCQRAKFPSL